MSSLSRKEIYAIIALALIIAEIATVATLAWRDLRGIPQICVVGGGCDFVQSSMYGQVFGVRLPILAVFAFTLLLWFYFLRRRWIYFSAVIVGALIALYLTIIQLAVLKATCSTCMVIDSMMFLIFVFSIAGKKI